MLFEQDVPDKITLSVSFDELIVLHAATTLAVAHIWAPNEAAELECLSLIAAGKSHSLSALQVLMKALVAADPAAKAFLAGLESEI